jgi:formamidopyrimidine-DNA glycosylase
MPELPEVETMRRGIAAVAGCRINVVARLPCPRKPITIEPSLPALRRRLQGRLIERTDRAGKRVVLWIDSGDALVFEPRMTGLVLLADPPDPLYSRVLIGLSSSRRGWPAQLLYWDRRGLGSVRLLTRKQFDAQLGPTMLGPDALAMTAPMYRERLGRSSRAIKVALLDQRAVAGIGNLYASEILHVAGVHPARPCRELSTAQWDRIAAAAHEVLETAILHEGSTLGDGTYRNALNQAGNYQNSHRVYDKAGAQCPQAGCRNTIVRIVQAQRSTFFCPGCQKRS